MLNFIILQILLIATIMLLAIKTMRPLNIPSFNLAWINNLHLVMSISILINKITHKMSNIYLKVPTIITVIIFMTSQTSLKMKISCLFKQISHIKITNQFRDPYLQIISLIIIHKLINNPKIPKKLCL